MRGVVLVAAGFLAGVAVTAGAVAGLVLVARPEAEAVQAAAPIDTPSAMAAQETAAAEAEAAADALAADLAGWMVTTGDPDPVTDAVTVQLMAVDQAHPSRGVGFLCRLGHDDIGLAAIFDRRVGAGILRIDMRIGDGAVDSQRWMTDAGGTMVPAGPDAGIAPLVMEQLMGGERLVLRTAADPGRPAGPMEQMDIVIAAANFADRRPVFDRRCAEIRGDD